MIKNSILETKNRRLGEVRHFFLNGLLLDFQGIPISTTRYILGSKTHPNRIPGCFGSCVTLTSMVENSTFQAELQHNPSPRDPGSPSENGFMEPKYYVDDWIPRVEHPPIYGLFTYMKGEKWPHEQGEMDGWVNIPVPWMLWDLFHSILGCRVGS